VEQYLIVTRIGRSDQIAMGQDRRTTCPARDDLKDNGLIFLIMVVLESAALAKLLLEMVFSDLGLDVAEKGFTVGTE
jgi:hypothetical protein